MSATKVARNRQIVLEMGHPDNTFASLGRRLGLSQSRVRYIWYREYARMLGYSIDQVLLSEREARQYRRIRITEKIRYLYKMGWNYSQIARDIGCHRNAVRRVIHRHVETPSQRKAS